MQYRQFKDIISTVLKNSKDKDTMEAVLKIIRFYYEFVYTGTESPQVFGHFYSDRLLFETIFAIGKAEKYAEFNQGNMMKLENLITKTLIESKLNTYKRRQQLFHIWLGGHSNYLGYNAIVEHLWTAYPSMNDIKEVKEELGLNVNADSLRKQLKGLKNVSR